ncbi:MFS general substrate transporter, partial [Chaetomidium leptoderma]
SGLPLASVTIALSAAVFLVAMDVNVIATAIPRITGEFRSLDDVGWYGSAFLMATCATQIPYGRIYSLFPAKWVFTSAIVVFMLGSLIAGVSPSSPVLILGRAVQGVGTSGILSGGFIIMSQVVPLRIRPTLTGGIGAMEGVAMISAPIIGGVLTDKLHWRWCFYINLPIGGFVLLVVLLCMRTTMPTGPRRSGKTTLRRTLYELDLLGAACLVPPIVCTLLALNFAGRQGHTWGDSDVILLLVLAVVLLCIFAYTQHIHADVAMLPFRVVKQRSVLAGFWFISCISSALVVITYFLPLWFQTVKDTSAQQSGIGILPMLVGVIIGVVASGALVSLIGYYTPFMLASSVLMPVGLGMLTTITPDTSRAALIAYPALFGLGVGMGFQQPLTGIQASLPQADIAPGTSIIVFGQTISAAIIIAVGESVFQNRLLVNLDSYLGINDVNTQELLGDSAGSLQSLVPVDKVPLLIEAVNASLTQTFYVAVAMAALSGIGSVFIGWNSVKQPKSRDEEGRAVVEPAQA